MLVKRDSTPVSKVETSLGQAGQLFMFSPMFMFDLLLFRSKT